MYEVTPVAGQGRIKVNHSKDTIMDWHSHRSAPVEVAQARARLF
jgi:hypothetical protein